MIKSPLFIVIILLFGCESALQGMYRPQTRGEQMFYDAANAQFERANRLESKLKALQGSDAECDSLKKELQELKAKCAGLDTALVLANEHIQNSHQQIEQKDAVLSELAHELVKIKGRKKEYKIAFFEEYAELKKSEEAHQTKDKVLIEVVCALSDLEDENKELTEKASKLSKEKKRLSAHYENEIAGVASISVQKHQQALAAIAGLRKEISPLRRELSPLRRQVTAKDSEIARLKEVLVNLQLEKK